MTYLDYLLYFFVGILLYAEVTIVDFLSPVSMSEGEARLNINNFFIQ